MKPSKETLIQQVRHYEAMIKKYIYDEMVWLTDQIAKSNLGMELVEAAKTGDSKKVAKVLDTFKHEYLFLTIEIEELSEYYTAACKPHVFAAKAEEADDQMLFKYDPEKIDIFNLFVLFWISEIEARDAFGNYDIAIEILKEKGHPKMAEYLCDFDTNDIIKDFINIFGNNN